MRAQVHVCLTRCLEQYPQRAFNQDRISNTHDNQETQLMNQTSKLMCILKCLRKTRTITTYKYYRRHSRHSYAY